jgi:hypothetical protein
MFSGPRRTRFRLEFSSNCKWLRIYAGLIPAYFVATHAGTDRPMTHVLCALFFLSGAAALLFETLWFHQAGLTFGNSVWASAIVLSSFMAGLALGNGAMARYGARVRRPVRFYAALEAVIAVTGVALVFVLPLLSEWLAPLNSR